MAITLVALFDSIAEAQQARQRLLQRGLGEDMVTLTSSEQTPATPVRGKEDQRGFFARLFGMDEPDESVGHYAEAVRRGSTVLTANLPDENSADRIRMLLEESGAIDVDRRVQQWKETGYTGYDPNAAPYTADQMRQERETFKVMREDLKIGKREVEGGAVRVHRRVTEQPVSEEVTLREERAVVDRRPVDREATREEMEAFEAGADRDVVIRETSEEPVVTKTARVVEEVSVGKEATQHTERIEDTVRSTEVDVENIDPEHLRKTPSRTQPPQPRR